MTGIERSIIKLQGGIRKNRRRALTATILAVILAAAAVSSVYIHAAVLMSSTGVQIAHQSYTHEPQPEEEEEGQTA